MGKKFYPFDPKTEDIDIKDIAHSLSLTCRYNGHGKYLYSVAEHCIRMVDIVSENNKLWALLHDAAETYIGDICKPIKNYSYYNWEEGYDDFRHVEDVERKILYKIAEKFNLNHKFLHVYPKEVYEADMIMAATEKRDIMVDSGLKWRKLPEPLKDRILPMYSVEEIFLETFEKLYKGRLVENTSYR